MSVEYWVMKRIASQPTEPELLKHVGRINRDELLYLNGNILEPLEQFSTEAEAYAAAVDKHLATGAIHHVVFNADM